MPACSAKNGMTMEPTDFCISVNTSYKQLKQVNFIDLVINTLHKYSLDPKYLILEITEDEAMEDPDLIINILTKLKSYGIIISLDDFGTGYSSLSYINKLPVDIIKIDRSLIMNLEEDSKNIFIIKLIIMMAHSLNIDVLAEGIETDAQFNILSNLKCDYIQGYLIGKPMDNLDFEKKINIK
jgi:EAL domain-containing protein (putative c-di-GMP-specific phosphodiesterase class I)